MMSNLFLLAQTTLPAAPDAPTRTAFAILTAAAATISVIIIHRRKLLRLPAMPVAQRALPALVAPSPQPAESSPLSYQPMLVSPSEPQVSSGVMLGVLISAVATYFAVAAVCFQFLGLTAANLKTPQGHRLAIFCQPLAQLAAAGVILGLFAASGSASGRGILQRRKPGLVDLWQGLSTWLLAWPLVILTGLLLEEVIRQLGIPTDQQHIIFETWHAEPAGMTLLKMTAFVSATICAPIAEELLFRGVFQQLLQRFTRLPVLAIVLTSLVFAQTHEPWTLRLPVFVLSLAIGWSYVRSGSIWVPIIAHAAFNAAEFGLFAISS